MPTTEREATQPYTIRLTEEEARTLRVEAALRDLTKSEFVGQILTAREFPPLPEGVPA